MVFARRRPLEALAAPGQVHCDGAICHGLSRKLPGRKVVNVSGSLSAVAEQCHARRPMQRSHARFTQPGNGQDAGIAQIADVKLRSTSPLFEPLAVAFLARSSRLLQRVKRENRGFRQFFDSLRRPGPAMAHYWARHDAKADEIDLAVRVALGAVLLHLHFGLRLDLVISEGRLDEREAWLRLPS